MELLDKQNSIFERLYNDYPPSRVEKVGFYQKVHGLLKTDRMIVENDESFFGPLVKVEDQLGVPASDLELETIFKVSVLYMTDTVSCQGALLQTLVRGRSCSVWRLWSLPGAPWRTTNLRDTFLRSITCQSHQSRRECD